MNDIKIEWKVKLEDALFSIAEKQEIEVNRDQINLIIETPPKPEMGDLAFPLFPLARIFKKNPAGIALDIKSFFEETDPGAADSLNVTGPYINIRIDLSVLTKKVMEDILTDNDLYGHTEAFKGQNVMVEFSCPNTNKPLHLGHLRNDSIGMSIAKIMAANGAVVRKVNLINDRGVHICKSMLAYQNFGEGSTPESTGLKSDHFVGNYYVKYNRWSKEESEAENQAKMMLKDWENGVKDIKELWKLMNGWAISGIKETYKKTGISFDEYYYESNTYLEGRGEVLKGFEAGVFF